jgi:1-acyl-sn-glycerol-3-phosphate acyltransferase
MSNRLEGARQMAQRLQQGQRLVVFPEGTFTSARGLLPFHLGAFRASVDTGCPIVPVAIAGTRHVLSDRTWLMRRGPITVTIGALLQPRTEGWPEMVRLRNAAVDFIARECGEPAGVPR